MDGADAEQPPADKASTDVGTACPVVAIGSSAGGVSALQELFQALRPDLGAAFVVICHLDPSRPSDLVALLQHRTSMPVDELTTPRLLEMNHVYVIAPDLQILIAGNQISTAPFSQPRGLRTPIDTFFLSLASQHGDGLAVVLSGSGSDGSIGARAVKAAGGIILVQDPGEARHGAMPRSVIGTGVADFVLPVSELALKLCELVAIRRQSPTLDQIEHAGGDIVRRILTYLQVRTGHDLSNYKRPPIIRRVVRRMQINRLTNLDSYRSFLKSNAEESRALFSDILTSVTTFFRDPEAFAALAVRAIPQLFKRDCDEPIRVWVAGCATGEEVYSLVILLLEEAAKHEHRRDIQVFATDLNADTLIAAREGRYPRSIEADVDKQRLDRYFTCEGDDYRIRQELRDLVVFAPHSVLRDPPFLRMDLLSCRNLLIFLDRAIQSQVLTTLHHALKPGGYLFLGSAETTAAATHLFRALDDKAKIFEALKQTSSRFMRPPATSAFVSNPISKREPAPMPPDPTARHVRALEESPPPSVLVDSSHLVLNLSETAGRFIQMPAGPPSANLITIVRPELRPDVSRGLAQAFQTGQHSLSTPVPVQIDGAKRYVMIQVRPIRRPNSRPEALVLFVEGQLSEAPPDESPHALALPQEEGSAHLRQELELTRVKLRDVTQNYETTIEALRAANEELQSLNEEYLLSSEELETNQEELQSTNQELQTLNIELKSRVDAITRYNSDLQNLIAATDGGTLFLDCKLQIKLITPRLSDYFNFTDNDEGRMLTDFTSRLNYPDLAADARAVLSRLIPIEKEVKNDGSGWSLVRIRPYRTADNRIDGVVLTVVDITPVRQATEALREAENRFRALVTATSDVTFRMNHDWSELRQLDGRGFLKDTPTPSTTWLATYVPAEEQARVERAIEDAIRTNSVLQLEHRVKRTDGSLGWALSRAVPLCDESGKVTEWFGAASDITARRHAEAEAADSDARYRAIVETASMGIVITDHKGFIHSANTATSSLFGYGIDELVGRNVSMLLPDDQAVLHDGYLEKYISAGMRKITGMDRTVTGRRKDGSSIELHLTMVEWIAKNGERFFGGLLTDLTERKRVEKELANARSMAAIGQLAGLIAHDSNNLLAVISGNLELLDQRIDDDDLHKLVRSAMRAAESSALFNRRLLSMGQRHRRQPATLRINDRLWDLAFLLQGALGPRIDLKLDLADDLWVSTADEGEIDSAVLNLVTNSRDALPNGGAIVVKTRNATVDPASTPTPGGLSGDFVCVSVIDEGIGMRKEVLARAIEPFFTTKEGGKGIGLGLHGVQTFAREAGGFFTIESRENDGTTASFYLPRTLTDGPVASDRDDDIPFGDGQLLLVVEDDDDVREVTLQRLEALGYAVEPARSAAEAIEVLTSGLKIDLIFSDIQMPGGQSGIDLANWAKDKCPEVKVVLTTGFAGDRADAIAYANIAILHKPYTKRQLATTLAEALASSAHSASPQQATNSQGRQPH